MRYVYNTENFETRYGACKFLTEKQIEPKNIISINFGERTREYELIYCEERED